MRILTRYVLTDLVRVLLVSLVALTPVMIIVSLVRVALQQGLPPQQVLALIPYVLPEALCVVIPVTLLLATTSVYARMAGANEIVAIKSQGISPTVILWPALILAFLLSLVTVWLNDLGVSWGRHGAQRVVVDAVEEIAYGMLRTRRSYSSPHFSINVKSVQGHRLIRPTLWIKQGGDSPDLTITAAEAELRSDPEKNVLTIELRDGMFDLDGEGSFRFPDDVWTQEIPLRDASRAENRSRVPSNIALRRIPQEMTNQIAKIEALRQELATRAAFQMLTGDFPRLAGPEWQTHRREMDRMASRLHRLRTEPHRRWSAGFSCLCFFWVGAPMAIRLRNQDFLTSFFLCFLPILVVYYPLMMWGVDGAKNGTIPPYAVWTGNLLLAAWGLLLLRKVIRY